MFYVVKDSFEDAVTTDGHVIDVDEVMSGVFQIANSWAGPGNLYASMSFDYTMVSEAEFESGAEGMKSYIVFIDSPPGSYLSDPSRDFSRIYGTSKVYRVSGAASESGASERNVVIYVFRSNENPDYIEGIPYKEGWNSVTNSMDAVSGSFNLTHIILHELGHAMGIEGHHSEDGFLMSDGTIPGSGVLPASQEFLDAVSVMYSNANPPPARIGLPPP